MKQKEKPIWNSFWCHPTSIISCSNVYGIGTASGIAERRAELGRAAGDGFVVDDRVAHRHRPYSELLGFDDGDEIGAGLDERWVIHRR